MVKKEMDAGILQKLKDRHVAFLPYVSAESVREFLRPDVKALQVLVWNSDNYAVMLPRVVAEVWHSHMERAISSVVNEQKVLRLESQLELERVRKELGAGIFTKSEEEDFSYIWKTLDRYEAIVVQKVERGPRPREQNVLDRRCFEVHVGSVVLVHSTENHDRYLPHRLEEVLSEILFRQVTGGEVLKDGINWRLEKAPSYLEELLMYGLVKMESPPQRAQVHSSVFTTLLGDEYIPVFADKMNRFMYWLAVKGALPKEILWRAVASEKKG
jgi:hypothetical protein